MKKGLAFFLIISIMLVSGCASNDSKNSGIQTSEGIKETSSFVSNNYYLVTINYAVQVIRINSDGVIKWIDCSLGRKQDKRTKYYGIYEMNGKELEITLSDKEKMNCVIHNNENSITIDGNEFEKADPNELSKKTLEKFE